MAKRVRAHSRRRKRLWSRDTGASLVEYGLVVGGIFLPLFFGAVGLGHALYAFHFVNNEAKEAARWAAVNGSTCGSDSSCNGVAPMNNGPVDEAHVATYVTNHLPPGIDLTKVTTVACGVLNGSLNTTAPPGTSVAPSCAESVPVSCATTPNAPGCTVGVRVSYSLTFIVPFLPGKAASTAANDPCQNRPGFCLTSISEMVIGH
jgi:Flp pilus assembly protein TadG